MREFFIKVFILVFSCSVMSWKKRVGIGMIVLGVLSILAGRVITGAAIGFGEYNLLAVLGGLALVLGIVIFLVERRGEGDLERMAGGVNSAVVESPAIEDTLQKYIEKYGPPPDKKDDREWITLYHATPVKEIRYSFKSKNKFIDKKKIRREGFYVADDPITAQEQLPHLDPLTEVAILKIQVAESVADDLGVEGINRDYGKEIKGDFEFARIPKSKIDYVNELYEAGYIRLGRGR